MLFFPASGSRQVRIIGPRAMIERARRMKCAVSAVQDAAGGAPAVMCSSKHLHRKCFSRRIVFTVAT